MSIEMDLSSVDQQIDSIRTIVDQYCDKLNGLKFSIQHFTTQTPDLKGEAYTSAKEYFSSVYLPLMDGLTAVLEQLKVDNSQLASEYRSDVDNESLDEDNLKKQLDILTYMIESYQKQLELIEQDPLLSKIPSYKLNLKAQIERCQQEFNDTNKKLQKLITFDRNSTHYFKQVEQLLTELSKDIRTLSQGHWNSDKQTFKPAKLSTNWQEKQKKAHLAAKKRDLADLKNAFSQMDYTYISCSKNKDGSYSCERNLSPSSVNNWADHCPSDEDIKRAELLGKRALALGLDVYGNEIDDRTAVKQEIDKVKQITGKTISAKEAHLRLAQMAFAETMMAMHGVKGLTVKKSTLNATIKQQGEVKNVSQANKEYKYSHSVTDKTKLDPLYHDFPKRLDSDILSNPVITRADGRIEHLAKGSVNGEKGIYQITVKEDSIIHRTFIPESDWTRFSRVNELPQLVDIHSLK